MRFICLGYLDPSAWEASSASEQTALMDECFAYDDVLRAKGHFLSGEGLQAPNTAATLRWKNGKVSITDGPFTEAKEILGGLIVLEAADRQQAIQLLAAHPGIKVGPWEIRPVEDMTQLIRESQQRRARSKK
jgi:hypothetical protein